MWCSRLQALNHTPNVNTHTLHRAPADIEAHAHLPQQCLKQWLSPVAGRHVSVSNTSHTAALRAKCVKQSAVSSRGGMSPTMRDGSTCLKQAEGGKKKKVPLKPPPTKTPLFGLTWLYKPRRRKFAQAGDFFFFLHF